MAGLTISGFLLILICCSILVKSEGKQSQRLAGKCELYTGTACKDYLGGKHIYLKHRTTQDALEERIAKWLQTAQTMQSVSDKCWPHAKVLICFHTFPVCDAAKTAPMNRKFCQDECRYLEQRVCRQEFQLARSIDVIKQYVPSCGTLPRPDSSEYATCWRLPSLDDLKYPRGLTVAYSRNSTAIDTGRASLKCYFKVYTIGRRSDDIKISWYRNNRRLDMRSRRYRLKRRNRGSFRFISTLIIKIVTHADAGEYECVAKQGAKTVKSKTYLKVLKDKKRKGKGGRKKNVDTSGSETKSDRRPYGNGLGKCAPYKGEVCAKYLKREGSSSVFEYSYSPQSLVEKQLVREFKRIKETAQFSDRCLEISLAVMCYNVFNACNKSLYTPVSRLCHEDCHMFDKVHCKYEVEMARKHSSAFEFLPDCTLLPEKNKLCEPIDRAVFGVKQSAENGTQCYKGVGKDYDGHVNVSKTGRHCKPWIKHSSVYKFTHNYCRNFGGENIAPWCFVGNGRKEFCSIPRCKGDPNGSGAETPDKSCYVGRGEDYRGQLSVSKTAQRCLQWNIMGQYEARHNYCRNYGGKREAPWCYVRKDKKEYCDVPKCSLSENNAETPDSSCYIGKGDDYRGQMRVSKTDQLCLQWNLVGPYEARHNYCRNYGGKRDAPWCYVSKDKMEYCHVPKCPVAAKVLKDKSPSLVYYVIPVAVALSVLLLVVLILLVYIKHRKKGDPADEAVQVPVDNTLPVNTVPVNTVIVSKEEIGAPRVPGPLDKQVPEVNDSEIEFLELIGKGFFLEMWKAELVGNNNSKVPLIVKRLNTNAMKGLTNALNLEISNVRGLDHVNVLALVCVSGPGNSPFLGYDGDSVRDLKSCLSSSRPEVDSQLDSDSRFQSVDFDVRVDMAAQVCSGMEYLHNNNIIHKDLGTRSCLIDNDGVVKIAHFGIGLYLHPEDYFHDDYITLPARWMAPEALQTKRFTKANDVWSFAVLIWELFSYAQRPYESLSDKEAMNVILEGKLLQCPDECPASLYSLMKDCWTLDPRERLTFSDALSRLNYWNGTAC